jgi:hypothetical protein
MPDGSGSPARGGKQKARLPENCAACVYRPARGEECYRKAPGTTTGEFEVTRWPLVRATDRCGEGAEIGDGSGPGITNCAWCIHWLQPEGQGVTPYHRQGLGRDWWEQSGYCTMHAPTPTADEAKHARWRVTNAQDGCGEGVRIPAPTE